jgi:hypothetical protein
MWDPAVTSITKTSPGPMGVGTTARLVRSDRRRQLQGSMKVTEYQPVSSFTVVSWFRPFTLQARTTFAPVAPASTSLQLVIDTHARGVMGLVLPLMKGTFRKTIARSLRMIRSRWKRSHRRRREPGGAQQDLLHAILALSV